MAVALIVLFAFCFATIVANEELGLSLTLNLTSTTFQTTLNLNEIVVVMFYAPWCSISKRLLEPFNKLSAESAFKNIVFAKVNCIDEPDLYWKFDIKGFPTFALFKGGDSLFFDEEPEIENVRNFIIQGASSKIVELDPKNFYEMDLTTRPLAVQFLPVETPLDASVTMDFACKKFKFPYCYASKSEEFAKLLGVPIPSYVLIKEYSTFNNPQEIINSTNQVFVNSDTLLHWMRHVSFPPLIEHTEDHQQLIFYHQRPGFHVHVVLFIKNKRKTVNQEILLAAEEVGQLFMNKLVFTFVDLDNSETQERALNMMEDMEVVESDLPSVVMILSATKSIKFYRYPLGNQITVASLSQWIDSYFNKELQYSKIIGDEN